MDLGIGDELGKRFGWHGWVDYDDERRAHGRVTRRMAMGEMAASIAHEIKQPLAAISANGNAGLRWLTGATPDIERARAVLKRFRNRNRSAKLGPYL